MPASPRSAQADIQVDRELMGAYLARTRSEVGELERRGLLLAGSAFPAVLLVKGVPGPAEQGDGTVLGGADGQALAAALARLGYPDGSWAALATFSPAGGDDPGAWRDVPPADVALAAETLDPELVVALDDGAARALAAAWELANPPVPGVPTYVRGRRVLALGGFEAALADPAAKRTMWARLKQVPPLAPPL